MLTTTLSGHDMVKWWKVREKPREVMPFSTMADLKRWVLRAQCTWQLDSVTAGWGQWSWQWMKCECRSRGEELSMEKNSKLTAWLAGGMKNRMLCWRWSRGSSNRRRGEKAEDQPSEVYSAPSTERERQGISGFMKRQLIGFELF